MQSRGIDILLAEKFFGRSPQNCSAVFIIFPCGANRYARSQPALQCSPSLPPAISASDDS